ncbi:MAG: bifunctional folylpolyglutamate synthase/dihydrofolate synthase [Alphaproteobacteria bacterium]|nr:MAG: bifunctional folylpolyglutamate synthase/dihydrofolate synthase [Alphaproteobacteria bacterium]
METSDRILGRLTALHPKKIDLSLGRMERLLAALGHPERRLPPVFHVAGTNGKGSTVAYLRAILEAAGLRVHVYTSPHLVRFAERIRLAGSLIEEDRLADILARCEAANGEAPITFFEITTAAALVAFAEEPADAVILEVGLGGRLDATNVVETPCVTAISPVSLDHREFLGDDLGGIAREKAGIAKPGCPLVVAPQEDEALAAIEAVARRAGVPLVLNGRDWRVSMGAHGLDYEDGLGGLGLPLPALRGGHQAINAGLAVACLRHQRHLPVPDHAFAVGLETVDWPARFQDISGAPGLKGRFAAGARVFLDGGHNPAAGAVLADAMAHEGGRFALIMGMMANKDVAGFLAPVAGHVERLIAIPIPGQACHDPRAIAAAARDLGISAHSAENFHQALAMIGEPARILICGSLYLAGQVLAEMDLPPR